MTKSITKKIKILAQKFQKDERGSIDTLVQVAITVLVLVAVFMIIPMIGDRLQTTTSLAANSSWNGSFNTKIINGRSLWEDNGSLISLAVSIAILGILIGYVIDLGGIRTYGGGGGQQGGQ